MDLTVFEWVSKLSRYIIDDVVLIAICYDRKVEDANETMYSALTLEQRELIQADIIYNVVMFSPSSTASQSQSHSGFQQNIGSQTDIYQAKKLEWAIGIYKKYNDPKADEISTGKIQAIKISDKV